MILPPKMHCLQQVVLSLHIRNQECQGKKNQYKIIKKNFGFYNTLAIFKGQTSCAMCITCRYLINSQLSAAIYSIEHVERSVGLSVVYKLIPPEDGSMLLFCFGNK